MLGHTCIYMAMAVSYWLLRQTVTSSSWLVMVKCFSFYFHSPMGFPGRRTLSIEHYFVKLLTRTDGRDRIWRPCLAELCYGNCKWCLFHSYSKGSFIHSPGYFFRWMKTWTSTHRGWSKKLQERLLPYGAVRTLGRGLLREDLRIKSLHHEEQVICERGQWVLIVQEAKLSWIVLVFRKISASLELAGRMKLIRSVGFLSGDETCNGLGLYASSERLLLSRGYQRRNKQARNKLRKGVAPSIPLNTFENKMDVKSWGWDKW